MKVFLAGVEHGLNIYIYKELEKEKNKKHLPILISYYYMTKKTEQLLPEYKNILLDSGAFTFMNNFKGKVNWDEYIKNYADFINKYDIKYFFELDIDAIEGIKEVERLRNKLETLTNKKCIPVWHKSRGLEYWKKMTKEYDYVAIGGIVVKEIKQKEYKYFKPLLEIAKKNKCKVHGLGFTNLKLLHKYHFYSVDSTAWTSGNMFGSIYKFEKNTLKKYNKPEGKKVKSKDTAINNFIEWTKFSEYADKYY